MPLKQTQGSNPRNGHIRASVSWALVHSIPMQPSQSLIKSLCYPHLFNVTSRAITHGKIYKKTAVETYVSFMSQTHKDFQVKYFRIRVDKNIRLHATPDFMAWLNVHEVLRLAIFGPAFQRRPPVLK